MDSFCVKGAEHRPETIAHASNKPEDGHFLPISKHTKVLILGRKAQPEFEHRPKEIENMSLAQTVSFASSKSAESGGVWKRGIRAQR
jgi:hypothetical protein